MDDLKSVVTAQIEKTNQEIEAAKAEAAKKAEAEEKRKAAEREICLKSTELTFNHRRDIVENSGVREVLEFVVQCLNSSDKAFSLLKESVLKMINNNPHNSADKNTLFSISNDSFNDNDRYHIYIEISNCHEYLMDVDCSDEDDLICMNRYLYGHQKNTFLEEFNSKVMAQQVVVFLMTD